MNKPKYYLQYNDQQYTCSIELNARTTSGAQKQAKTIAAEERITIYNVVVRSNGQNKQLGAT